jgi:hypothetical protein
MLASFHGSGYQIVRPDAGHIRGHGAYQPIADRGVLRPHGESTISASGAPGYRDGPGRRPGLSMRSYGSTGRLARLDAWPRGRLECFLLRRERSSGTLAAISVPVQPHPGLAAPPCRCHLGPLSLSTRRVCQRGAEVASMLVRAALVDRMSCPKKHRTWSSTPYATSSTRRRRVTEPGWPGRAGRRT